MRNDFPPHYADNAPQAREGSVITSAVYTAFYLLDEHDNLPKVSLAATGVVIMGSMKLSYPPMTWLTGVPLTVLPLWLGHQTGPYARPVAEAHVRAFR